jgi:dolichol kinase
LCFLEFYQLFTGEERRIPLIFDDFHFCRSRVIGPLFISKLLIKFQNILRNTTQVIIRHRVKMLFSVISSPITLERQKCKSSKMKGILLSSPVNSRVIGLDMTENRIFALCRMITSSVSQNVLKFYQQLTGEERMVPFIFGRNNR